MSVGDIFKELESKKISIGINDGKLKVVDLNEELTPSLIEKLKNNKQELIKTIEFKEKYDNKSFAYADLSLVDIAQISVSHPNLECVYVASPLQKGMIYEENLAGMERAYTQQFSYKITGKLDVESLKLAWNEVVARHQALRTCFVGFDSKEIHQLVEKTVDVPFTVIDESQVSESEKAEKLQYVQEQEKKSQFDYAKAPLIKVVALKFADNENYLILTYHHAILDGWSIPLLMNDVYTLYNDFSKNSPPEQDKSDTYLEYVEWVVKKDKGDAIKYWKNLLADYSLKNQYAFSQENISIEQDRTYKVFPLNIDSDISAKIDKLCAAARCTVSAFLQFVWGCTLSRFSNVEDIVFGAVSSVRPPEIESIENTVGFFINTVPVRVKLDAKKTIADILKDLTVQSVESAEQAYIGLDEIKSTLPRFANSKLFDGMFVFQNYPSFAEGYSAGGEGNANFEMSGYSEVSNFGLTLYGARIGNKLSLEIASHICSQPSSVLVKYFETLLRKIAQCGISAKLEDIIASYNVPESKKKDKALEAWTGGLESIASQIDRQASENKKAVAIVDEDGILSYRDMNERVNQLANYLTEFAVDDNETVAICLSWSKEVLIAILACVKARKRFLMFDPSELQEQVSIRFKLDNVNLVISEENVCEVFGDVFPNTVVLDFKETKKLIKKQSKDFSNGASVAFDKNCLYSIHFKNEHGKFESECITEEVLSKLIKVVNAHVGEGTRVSCISHTMTKLFPFQALSALCCGRKVYFLDSVEDLCHFYGESPDVLNLSFADIESLMSSGFDWDEVDTINLYDCTLNEELLNAVRKKYTGIFNIYLSQPSQLIVSSFASVNKEKNYSVVFNEIEGYTEVSVRYLGVSEQPLWAIGELFINGQSTGDCVRKAGKTGFQFVSESESYFSVNGNRIDYSDIEKELLKVSSVKECAVKSSVNNNGRSRLVAYIVLDSGFSEFRNRFSNNDNYYNEVNRCREELLSRLSSVLLPEEYIFLAELPLAKNGSIDKASLIDPDEMPVQDREVLRPRNDIEKTIMYVWEEGFMLSDLSIEDDFYDLGGSSLLQINMTAGINKLLKVKISMRELFELESVTVAKQASVVEEFSRKSNQSN